MASHSFILDRQMVAIIKDICAKRAIALQSLSNDWILELNKGGTKSFIYGYRFGINSSSSESITRDKVATYQVLDAAGITAVPHVLISTRATAHDEWKALAKTWGRFIVKPLHGGGGRGLKLFTDVARAEEYMKSHSELEWCASPFLELTSETRVILLDDDVLLSFEKQDPQLYNDIPMFNLRLGATAANIEPSEEMKHIAHAARRAVNLRLTAVDIVRTTSGELKVLELNDGFSLEHYLRQQGENREAAVQVYERILDTLFPY